MRNVAVVLAAGLLGGWSPSVAQSNAPPPSIPVQRETIVVSATVEPEPAVEVPATVTVIDRAEIERRQSDRVVDLLRTVPGVAVVESGSPGKVASFFLRGANSNQTLVLWDGVELNDPAFGAFDASTLTTDGLERIEVARGPFSAVWGSSAMGGVVELVTRRARGDALDLRLEGGSHAFRRAGGSAGLVRGRATLELAAHVRRGDGELANDFFDGDAESADGDLFPTGATRLGLVARRVASTIGIPFDYAGTPTPNQRQRFRSTLVALPFGWTSPRLVVDATVSRHDDRLAVSDPDDPFATSTTVARRDALRASTRIDLGNGATLAAGGSSAREQATTGSAFGPGLDGDHQRTRALFGELGWRRGAWSGTLGARHDANDAFGGATSLRGGVVAALSPATRLRASYGESFRAPSLGDLYYPGFSNPDLRPERGRSFELGAEGGARRSHWSATGFWNDFDQLILYDFATGRPENVGRARSRGVELGAGARGTKWDGELSATWLEAVERPGGEPLPRRPRWSGQAELFRTFGLSRSHRPWNAGAIVRVVGARTDVGGVPLAGYTALDLRTTVELTRRWSSFVALDNALDRGYQEAAGYPAPGRAVRLGVSVRAGG